MSQKSELVPKRRFKEFENAGDWEQRELGDFVIKAVDNRGKTPPTQEFGRYPLLEVASLGKASPDYTKVTKYVDEETYNGWFRAYIKKDDILFSTVGNTGLVTLMDGYAGATIAQNIVGFRAIEGNNPQFLVQMFQLPENLKRAKRIEMGAVQPSIKVSQLIHVSYLLPNSEQEQEKIGSFFKHLDDTITLHQHKLDKLNNIKQSYLYQMFPQNGQKVPTLRFAGFSGDWEERQLDDIADMFDNLRVPVKASDRSMGSIPYYGANGIQDYVDGFTHNGEFVLIAEDGANDLINYPVQYVKGKVWVNNHAHVVSGRNGELSNLFLLPCIKAMDISSILVGGGRAKLNGDILKKLNIKLPSFEEQNKIGQFFKQLDENIEVQEQELEKLKNLKEAYLNEMFV